MPSGLSPPDFILRTYFKYFQRCESCYDVCPQQNVTSHKPLPYFCIHVWTWNLCILLVFLGTLVSVNQNVTVDKHKQPIQRWITPEKCVSVLKLCELLYDVFSPVIWNKYSIDKNRFIFGGDWTQKFDCFRPSTDGKIWFNYEPQNIFNVFVRRRQLDSFWNFRQKKHGKIE